MDIKQDFIPVTNNNRPGYAMTPEYITIHETANRSAGADAAMHAHYVKNPSTAVSWHYTVDDGSIVYQHLPTNENGWHAGDGGQGTGNRKSIGIEICVNQGGNFERAKSNAATLVRTLLDEHNLSIDRVVLHQHWSGKNCPATILNSGGLEGFKALIPPTGEQQPNTPAPAPPNQPAPKTTPTKPTAPASGGGIVNWMNTQGMDSSYANRARLAAQYGIVQYRGTVAQNTELFKSLQKSQTPAKPIGNQTTTSIVTYLNSIGIDSSYANRARLASQHNITNYRGTAQQNTRLLELVRGGSAGGARLKARQGEGIVDYMNRVGLDSSYTNRARLATQYGIKNYKGTASQNNQLLNLISG
ncbi:N-acetylmuramoyl-L-alanine amidase [Shouchella patagoniensis]|uniref:N-acetylmuramoyl-L-alanine amidase n=1 Tax=Shouchella patagoniensis TaxID=228576 RepID=UPI000994F515